MEIPVVNCRLGIFALLVIYCLPVISGAAGLARVSRATLVDDEDMVAELTNGELQFEIILTIDLMCTDEWFNDEARYTFMKIIRDSLFTYINDRCSCGFNESGLTNEQITCDLAMYHYSAELLTSAETHNQYVPSQILEDISEWPKEHPKILLNSTRFGGPALLNLSFIVESTEVSFSGDASGDDDDVPRVSEPESSGGDNTDIVITPPGGGDQEDPTDKSVVVVDKQEQPDDSHGRRNRMSVLVVGALLTLVLILAL